MGFTKYVVVISGVKTKTPEALEASGVPEQLSLKRPQEVAAPRVPLVVKVTDPPLQTSVLSEVTDVNEGTADTTISTDLQAI
jgi:hypothetical protein